MRANHTKVTRVICSKYCCCDSPNVSNSHLILFSYPKELGENGAPRKTLHNPSVVLFYNPNKWWRGHWRGRCGAIRGRRIVSAQEVSIWCPRVLSIELSNRSSRNMSTIGLIFRVTLLAFIIYYCYKVNVFGSKINKNII